MAKGHNALQMTCLGKSLHEEPILILQTRHVIPLRHITYYYYTTSQGRKSGRRRIKQRQVNSSMHIISRILMVAPKAVDGGGTDGWCGVLRQASNQDTDRAPRSRVEQQEAGHDLVGLHSEPSNKGPNCSYILARRFFSVGELHDAGCREERKMTRPRFVKDGHGQRGDVWIRWLSRTRD